MILTKEGRTVELHNEAHQHAYLRAGWEAVEEQKQKPKPLKRAAKPKAKTEE